jgi:hypothetical protein
MAVEPRLTLATAGTLFLEADPSQHARYAVAETGLSLVIAATPAFFWRRRRIKYLSATGTLHNSRLDLNEPHKVVTVQLPPQSLLPHSPGAVVVNVNEVHPQPVPPSPKLLFQAPQGCELPP